MTINRCQAIESKLQLKNLIGNLFVFLQDPALTRRVERLCDTVVKLESFVGSENETNPVYKDYHGEQVILLTDYFSHQQRQRSLAL